MSIRGHGRSLLGEAGQDLGYVARSVRRRPALLAGGLLTLAIGIDATTALVTRWDLVASMPGDEPPAQRSSSLPEASGSGSLQDF